MAPCDTRCSGAVDHHACACSFRNGATAGHWHSKQALGSGFIANIVRHSAGALRRARRAAQNAAKRASSSDGPGLQAAHGSAHVRCSPAGPRWPALARQGRLDPARSPRSAARSSAQCCRAGRRGPGFPPLPQAGSPSAAVTGAERCCSVAAAGAWRRALNSERGNGGAAWNRGDASSFDPPELSGAGGCAEPAMRQGHSFHCIPGGSSCLRLHRILVGSCLHRISNKVTRT